MTTILTTTTTEPGYSWQPGNMPASATEILTSGRMKKKHFFHVYSIEVERKNAKGNRNKSFSTLYTDALLMLAEIQQCMLFINKIIHFKYSCE